MRDLARYALRSPRGNCWTPSTRPNASSSTESRSTIARATSEPWALVATPVRRATLEILGAHAEQIAGRDVPLTVRDPLTTLITARCFELALAQEIPARAAPPNALALLLFDIDDLSQINREHGGASATAC